MTNCVLTNALSASWYHFYALALVTTCNMLSPP